MEHHAAGHSGSSRRGSSPAGARARPALGAEPRRGPAGRQRLHDSLPGKRYQIDRKAIVPGLRGGKVRVESGLDGKLVARFGKHELALKRCLTRPESNDATQDATNDATKDATKQAGAEKALRPTPRRKGQRLDGWLRPEEKSAAVAGGAGFRRPAGRSAGLAVTAQPKLHLERRANGARRSSRCLSRRPQLRDFAKAIVLTNPLGFPNPAAAGSGPTRKAVLTRSVGGDGCALSAMGTGICPQLPAGQGGLAECPQTKPSDGDARGSCHAADCFGASTVASALGSEDRREPALHSHYPTTASPAARPKPDISIRQRLGHFYLALTHHQHHQWVCYIFVPIRRPGRGFPSSLRSGR